MIPKQFTVGYKTYKVEMVPIITDNSMQIYGQFDPKTDTISIAQTVDGVKVSEKDKLATFYHELIHAVLYAMGEHELNNDERFIEGFSTFLTQFNLTRI